MAHTNYDSIRKLDKERNGRRDLHMSSIEDYMVPPSFWELGGSPVNGEKWVSIGTVLYTLFSNILCASSWKRGKPLEKTNKHHKHQQTPRNTTKCKRGKMGFDWNGTLYTFSYIFYVSSWKKEGSTRKHYKNTGKRFETLGNTTNTRILP